MTIISASNRSQAGHVAASLPLLLLSTFVLAATTSETKPATWGLYREAILLSRHSTQGECESGARADAERRRASARYSCRLQVDVVVVYAPGPVGPQAAPRPNQGNARITLTPPTYSAGGYTTIVWSGRACTKSSEPAYTVWNETGGDQGGRSLAPNVTTTLTLTCADGTASAVLTVTGAPPQANATSAGRNGTSASSSTPDIAATLLPVPSLLPQAIELRVNRIAGNDRIRSFAHTAQRNWNFDGHKVAESFSRDQGYWDYQTCPQDYAVWLFDRPTAFFKLHEMTGEPAYRDQAISDTRYYASHINVEGFFDCKSGEADTKYLYVTPFLLYERATGDTSLRPVAARLYAQSERGFSSSYSRNLDLWTEREVGIHLGAAVSYYELTGNTQALARAAALVNQWQELSTDTGAPMVSYTQHEGGGPGGTQPTSLTNSPWMSAIYFQAARRYWQLTGDQKVLQQASRYFDWLTVNGLYDGSLFHPEFTGVTVPRYLTGELIGDAGYDEGNLLHCPDVMGFVAFAIDAKRRLGLATAAADARLVQLRTCTTRMYSNWTRDTSTLPKYRIQAPRAFNWWVHGLYESAR